MIRVTHDEHCEHTIAGIMPEDVVLLKKALKCFQTQEEETLRYHEFMKNPISPTYQKILLDNIYNANKILNALKHPLVEIRAEVSE